MKYQEILTWVLDKHVQTPSYNHFKTTNLEDRLLCLLQPLLLNGASTCTSQTSLTTIIRVAEWKCLRFLRPVYTSKFLCDNYM
ncbi:hypothetical protein AC249_AIPGENE24459 [Exaiptasia diaphana]|nr:hypothetical protein AC249_AIPGENE24459 [Exaiptasia diaphana]